MPVIAAKKAKVTIVCLARAAASAPEMANTATPAISSQNSNGRMDSTSKFGKGAVMPPR